MLRSRLLALAGALAVTATLATPAYRSLAARSGEPAKPSVVLVHGAFADASGWDAVIRILQAKGYEVSAVQNPLTSYAADIETTKRLIDAQTGPTVVVAHSYGGAVITAAAAGNPNVKSLVFLAAFANDVDEPLGALLEKYPSKAVPTFRPDAAGLLTIDRAKFHEIFAQDLPLAQTNVMAVTQKPLASSAFGATTKVAAWRTDPLVVRRGAGRQRDQPGSRALLREADGRRRRPRSSRATWCSCRTPKKWRR